MSIRVARRSRDHVESNGTLMIRRTTPAPELVGGTRLVLDRRRKVAKKLAKGSGRA